MLTSAAFVMYLYEFPCLYFVFFFFLILAASFRAVVIGKRMRVRN